MGPVHIAARMAGLVNTVKDRGTNQQNALTDPTTTKEHQQKFRFDHRHGNSTTKSGGWPNQPNQVEPTARPLTRMVMLHFSEIWNGLQ